MDCAGEASFNSFFKKFKEEKGKNTHRAVERQRLHPAEFD